MTIIGSFIQSILCLGIFYGFYSCFLKRETTYQLNRIYLFITLIISLGIPFIEIPIDTAYNQISGWTGKQTNLMRIKNDKLPQGLVLNWLLYFKLIYFTGFTFYLFRFVYELLKLESIRRKGRMVIFRDHTCIFSKCVQVPFSFFKNIYLPDNRLIDEHDLIRTIQHESVHIANKHSIDILLFEFLKIVLWMNPFVHLYLKKIRELHEFIADKEVIKQTDWDTYCNFLIRSLHYSRLQSLASHLAQSPLKTRFIMMKRNRTTRAGKWKYIGFFPLVIFSSLLFSCSDSNQNLTSCAIGNEPEAPLEILITEDLQYQIQSRKYSIAEVENLILNYQAATKDPLVNVRAANLSDLTVGDISVLGDIALRLHLRMEFYTEN